MRRWVGIQSDMSIGDWLEHITQFANWLTGAVHVMRAHWLAAAWGGEIDDHVINAWSGHENPIPYCEEVDNRELSFCGPFNAEYTHVLVLPPCSCEILKSTCYKYILANSLCFPCLEKWTFKFPVFPVPWQPCTSLNFCSSKNSCWPNGGANINSCSFSNTTDL